MTDIAIRFDAATAGADRDTTAPAAARTGILARIGEAFIAMQRRRVEREVARVIHLNCGLLSDEAERNIARQFNL